MNEFGESMSILSTTIFPVLSNKLGQHSVSFSSPTLHQKTTRPVDMSIYCARV